MTMTRETAVTRCPSLTLEGADVARLYSLLSHVTGDDDIAAAGLPEAAGSWSHDLLGRIEAASGLDPFKPQPWPALNG